MKRLFPRQLLLTICLVLLTLLLVSASFQVMLYQYVLNVEQQNLNETARAAAEMMRFLDMGQPGILPALQLDYTARATGDDAVLCDVHGTVVACSCGMQRCEHIGKQLDGVQLQQAALSATAPKMLSQELYGEKRLTAVSLVVDPAGVPCGYILASTGYDAVDSVMRDALKINLRTILIILPICVIAVWLVVRRQTKPIKELTAAAKQLRRGQMSARVPTDSSNTTEIQELAVAFNNMAQALEKSETRRQEFVANVSHELKTPMTTISGYMDGMLDGTIPPEQQRHYMEVTSEEVKRLARLVRNMLDISRLQGNPIPPEKKRRFDLCESVGQTLITLEQKINAKHLEVETELPPEGAMSYADPDAITQVIYNLTENAVKFSAKGGTLGIKIGQTANNKYLLTVTNDGQTIPPEELPLVFDRFHKADKSRSADREGWGLGLYIVHTIIRSHGEDIFVTSRDGKTSFSFTMQKAEM